MIKTLVISPIFTRSGYGEHGRFIVNALSSQPDVFDLHVHPIHWGLSSWISETHPNVKHYEELTIKKELNQDPYDLVIQVTVPGEWATYASRYPGKCNIGITAGVETDRIPSSWLEPCGIMDHIIFTSKHTKDGFTKPTFKFKAKNSDDIIKRKGISTSSEVIGYPAKSLTPCDLSDKISLSTEYNFLTISQIAPRKGVENLVNWFMEEFQNENVGLVAKLHHGNNSNHDAEMLRHNVFKPLKQKFPDAKCKIHWIHGSMSEAEIHGLYLHPQIHSYISTTHGEGFGLPIYEAAYSGMPVCVTGWSGHLDFLKMPTSSGKKYKNMYEKIKSEIREIHEGAVMEGIIEPGMKWAHCDKVSAKKAMRNMINARAAKKAQAQQLQQYLHQNFSEKIQFEKVCNACKKTYNEKVSWTKEVEEVSVI